MLTIILRNLIAIRLIPPEVMLPIPAALSLNLAPERERGANSRKQRLLLKPRLRTRQSGVKGRNMSIRCARQRGPGCRKELALGVELSVNLNADREFPFT